MDIFCISLGDTVLLCSSLWINHVTEAGLELMIHVFLSLESWFYRSVLYHINHFLNKVNYVDIIVIPYAAVRNSTELHSSTTYRSSVKRYPYPVVTHRQYSIASYMKPEPKIPRSGSSLFKEILPKPIDAFPTIYLLLCYFSFSSFIVTHSSNKECFESV